MAFTVAYIGVIILLLLFENSMVYHPIKATAGWETPPTGVVQDVEWIVDGGKVHGWWSPVEQADFVVLFCHGNAGNLSHRGYAINFWRRELRASVLLFDYPGFGRSEGSPSETGCYHSADAAYSWLVNQSAVSANQVLLVGESLGGGVAVDLATRKNHRALVLISAFTSVPDMAQLTFPWIPVRWLVRNRFDNLDKIKDCHRPVFIAHGDIDRLVPFSMAQRLFEAANVPRMLYTLGGHDHNNPPGESFYRALSDFLKANP